MEHSESREHQKNQEGSTVRTEGVLEQEEHLGAGHAQSGEHS